MPILYDKKRKEIVSNDSWSIVKMLASAFSTLGNAKLARPPIDLAPRNLAAEMDAVHQAIYDTLLNGVYKAGISRLKRNDEAAQAASAIVYRTLDELDGKLSKQRFLLGTPQPTAVDVRLTMTLLRWDASYQFAFGLGGGQGTGGVLLGDGYPNLRDYTRDMYALFGADCVDWPSIRQYYRWGVGHPKDAPLPPLEPIIASAEAPHGRAEQFA